MTTLTSSLSATELKLNAGGSTIGTFTTSGAATLTGLVSMATTTMLGSGTAFTTELSPGDEVVIDGTAESFTVVSITNDTTAVMNRFPTVQAQYVDKPATKGVVQLRHGTTTVLELAPSRTKLKLRDTSEYGDVLTAVDAEGTLAYTQGIPQVFNINRLEDPENALAPMGWNELHNLFVKGYGGTQVGFASPITYTETGLTVADDYKNYDAAVGDVMDRLNRCTEFDTGGTTWILRHDITPAQFGSGARLEYFLPGNDGILEMTKKNTDKTHLKYTDVTGDIYTAHWKQGTRVGATNENTSAWVDWKLLNGSNRVHKRSTGNHQIQASLPRYSHGTFHCGFRVGDSHANTVIFSGTWCSDRSKAMLDVSTHRHKNVNANYQLLVSGDLATGTGLIQTNANVTGFSGSAASGTIFVTELENYGYVMIGNRVMKINRVTSDTVGAFMTPAPENQNNATFFPWGVSSTAAGDFIYMKAKILGSLSGIFSDIFFDWTVDHTRPMSYLFEDP